MEKGVAKRLHVELTGLVYLILRRPESAVLGLSPLFIAGVAGLLVDAPVIYLVWFVSVWVCVLGSLTLDILFTHNDQRVFYQQSHLLVLAVAWLVSVIMGIVAVSLAATGATTFWCILAVLHSLWRLADLASLAALESQGTRQMFLDWITHSHMRSLNPNYDPASADSATIELEATDE
jgi:hypothetical protein